MILVLLAICVWQDVKTNKVSNRLLLLGLAGGALYKLVMWDWQALASFGGGLLLPVFVLYPLFRMRIIGGGDIKLFSVIGSYLTMGGLLWWMIVSFFLAGFLSLLLLAGRGILVERLTAVAHYLQYAVQNFPNMMSYQNFDETKRNRMHFTIPMLIGYLCSLVFQ